MKYYEGIIKRDYYDTVLYRKKLRRGEKKIWLFVLGPDGLSRNLPLHQSEVR